MGPEVSAGLPRRSVSSQSSSNHQQWHWYRNRFIARARGQSFPCAAWLILQNGMNMEGMSRSDISRQVLCAVKSPLQRAVPAQTHSCMRASISFTVEIEHGFLCKSSGFMVHSSGLLWSSREDSGLFLSPFCNVSYYTGITTNDRKSVSLIDKYFSFIFVNAKG